MFKQYKLKNYHFDLIIYVVILSIIGIMLIGSAKESVQNKQILGFIGGLIIMVIVSLMDYSFLLKFVWFYYVGIIGLLTMVKFMGEGANGSVRWVEIAGIQFQPSELAKIVFILFFSYFFTKYTEKINTPKIWLISLVLAAVPLYLIKSQPDLSTTIITAFIFIMLLFIGGLSYKIVIGALSIGIPTVIVGLVVIIQKGSEILEPYQYRRIMSWLYPMDKQYSDIAAQQRNSIMAIGSGQLTGKGLDNSVATSMKNTGFIIEPQTDFILAVAGEELGFVGTALIIILLLLIVLKCIRIGYKAKDMYGSMICCGVATLIGFQSFVNVSVATGLFPNTGVPLPFVSYGLTSLMSLFIAIGLVLNVGLQPKKYR